LPQEALFLYVSELPGFLHLTVALGADFQIWQHVEFNRSPAAIFTFAGYWPAIRKSTGCNGGAAMT
jgi:hypothetical protein